MTDEFREEGQDLPQECEKSAEPTGEITDELIILSTEIRRMGKTILAMHELTKPIRVEQTDCEKGQEEQKNVPQTPLGKIIRRHSEKIEALRQRLDVLMQQISI